MAKYERVVQLNNSLAGERIMDQTVICNRVKRYKRRSKCLLVVAGVCTLLTLIGFLGIFTGAKKKNNELIYSVYGDFLINGPNCKIPNMNPFDKEAMKIFDREEFEACSKKQPLTTIEMDRDGKAKLIFHDERKKDFLSWWQDSMECCYQRIIRAGRNETADKKVELSKCKTFTSSHYLETEDEFILVSCTGFKGVLNWQHSSVIYKNVHAIVSTKQSVTEKFKNGSKSKISVLMVGIDSISRLNLIRALPETYEHLESSGWFEMRGYNKMGDNTLPNFMAILTGRNETMVKEFCNWKEVGGVEKCRFLWNDFEEAGYATGYAEDEANINTFNYQQPGFIKQPVDHYLRPFGLGAEKYLSLTKNRGNLMCLGYQHYADHVYQYGLDFAVKYKKDASFGLFWTNSFSHDILSMPSSMDSRVVYYLKQLEVQGILDSSIVIFFSDHGIRFGPIRKLFIGWLEERLPFFYIWLPQKFQRKHPEIVRNLEINRDRLSSPYDVHITLKQVLQMSGGFDSEPSAISCPTCQSLFEELPLERTCAEAGVSKHWCTCVEFEEIDKSSELVKKVANQIVKQVNVDLSMSPQCAKLYLGEIQSARKSLEKSSTDFLISLSVEPSEALLEATVRCQKDCNDLSIIGSVSRLNRYGNQSYCVDDKNLKKYCFCN